MHRWLTRALIILLFGIGCQNRDPNSTIEEGDADEPPRWHFNHIEHTVGDMTLTDVYGRDDGTVVVVGWYGTIFTNRRTEANPQGLWRPMASGTTEHLTGVYGVSNGRQFNQPERRDGEMFAVGWNGTILHFHPNPAAVAEPQPEDGQWQVIAGPGQGFTPRMKIDPFCADYDGDGILDDNGGDPVTGGPDGWWSRKDTCVDGATTNCDDNCRASPNGPERPIVDIDGDFGVDPDGTGPLPAPNCLEFGQDHGDPANSQTDEDADGVGTVCDDALGEPALQDFRPTLFDVWASEYPGDDTRLVVVAVGENGALVSYVGPNAAQTVVAPELPLNDRDAWIAQEQIPFWYSNDCPFLGVPPDPDGTCPGSGRLPPRCPAQCNVLKAGGSYGNGSACECLVDQGQCCAAGGTDETNGAACTGPGCGIAAAHPDLGGTTNTARAADGCDTTSGQCYDGCSDCFRRLDKTLRAITSDGSTLVAVGAAGTVIYLGNITNPTNVWTHPHCGVAAPAPLDERPILTAVSTAADRSFEAVGAAGAVVIIRPNSGGCDQYPRCGSPPAFLSGVFSLGAGRAYAVGDVGTLVELVHDNNDCSGEPPSWPVVEIENDVEENFNAVWVTRLGLLWIAGASGNLVRAGFYSAPPEAP